MKGELAGTKGTAEGRGTMEMQVMKEGTPEIDLGRQQAPNRPYSNQSCLTETNYKQG